MWIDNENHAHFEFQQHVHFSSSAQAMVQKICCYCQSFECARMAVVTNLLCKIKELTPVEELENGAKKVVVREWLTSEQHEINSCIELHTRDEFREIGEVQNNHYIKNE